MADKYVKLDNIIETLEHEWGYEGIREDLYNLPTADVVEVVRCKDCKYGEVDDTDFPNQYLCNHSGCDWNEGKHFCSYGERKMRGNEV